MSAVVSALPSSSVPASSLPLHGPDSTSDGDENICSALESSSLALLLLLPAGVLVDASYSSLFSCLGDSTALAFLDSSDAGALSLYSSSRLVSRTTAPVFSTIMLAFSVSVRDRVTRFS